MTRGSIHGRLERLEERTTSPEPPPASEARRRMLSHLARIVALRRGELDAEEAAEVETLNAAVRRRFEEFRGEGGS